MLSDFSNVQTFKILNHGFVQTFKLSNVQTVTLSIFAINFKLSNVQTILREFFQISIDQTFRLSNFELGHFAAILLPPLECLCMALPFAPHTHGCDQRSA